jgi:hypothetical protein
VTKGSELEESLEKPFRDDEDTGNGQAGTGAVLNPSCKTPLILGFLGAEGGEFGPREMALSGRPKGLTTALVRWGWIRGAAGVS